MGIAILVAAFALCAHADVIEVAGRNQAAIAEALDRSGPGDTVRLDAGVYALDATLTLKTGVRVMGAGQDKTILRFTAANPCPMVGASGCEDAELCHLTLDGQSDPKATQGISGSHAQRLNIHHVTVSNLVKGEGFGPHGVLFAGNNPTREGGVTDSIIADCHFQNIGVGADFGGGIRLSWGSSRNQVLRNTIHCTGRGGIFADNGSTDVVIRGNVVTGSGGEGLGIEVWGGCDRAVIEDNVLDHWLSIGGCEYCAARRNVIADASGVFKPYGIEGIGSYLVITDNLVDGHQKIGLSVSSTCKKDYALWARNTVRRCNQWGAQFQGEATGIACHYLYACTFERMPVGEGPVWYPGDEGHGFRFNGNCRNIVFENCIFRDNARLGVQVVGAGVDRLRFARCTLAGNTGAAIAGLVRDTAIEWDDCDVHGNGNDALPEGRAWSEPTPEVGIEIEGDARVGKPVRFIARTHAAEGRIAMHLWDLDDGPPRTESEVEHTYRRPGIYRVILVVWDDAGRAARTDRELQVAP
ncbi:MAG TPA: right-handed parallel beta-helix repeat-containing protein [Candidatus Hydrogenedentes bacterium]|nr:right-handed parallel beta-helix repeat-containing protein [Candidatus Hydrogenedentota bacterium]HPG67483.1 right-handed parallel beta-helix repeat-containing protein [Candidatus Hydrogenedentota bacterium]